MHAISSECTVFQTERTHAGTLDCFGQNLVVIMAHLFYIIDPDIINITEILYDYKQIL